MLGCLMVEFAVILQVGEERRNCMKFLRMFFIEHLVNISSTAKIKKDSKSAILSK